MTLLDRYIAGELARAFLIVMLVLVSLASFLDLIQQLDYVGKANYGLMDVVLFELRMLGPRCLDVLPFGALMASTIALALLAQHSEVIAAQAAGVSAYRIAWAVLKSGLLLALAAVLLDEFVISRLHQEAVRERSLALSAAEVLQRDGGFWIHSDNRFIHIQSVLHGRIPRGIDVLELDDEKRVRLFVYAETADISDPENWILRDVVLKKFHDGKLVTEHLPQMHWDSYLTVEQVDLLEFRPETMSRAQLYAYLRVFSGRGQKTDRYELAFWQKMVLPISTGVMLLLALPAAFGTLRSRSIGRRMIVSLIGGVLFQICMQVAANAGLILQLDPALATFATPVAATLVALIFLRRVGVE